MLGFRVWVAAGLLSLAACTAAAEAIDAPMPSGTEHGTQGTRVFVSLGFDSPIIDLTEWGQTWIAEAE